MRTIKRRRKLESEYDHETSPKRRVKIAIDLADLRLKELREAYESEDPARENERMEDYISSLGRLEKAVNTSGAGTSKDAEIHLRRQGKILENLKMSVSYNERSPIEQVADRVTKLHEHVLYSIMKPKRNRPMNRFLLILFCLLMGAATSALPAGAKDEFLTPQEINDLRDEQDAGKRILLYLSFAQRRLDNIRASSASDSRKAGVEIQKSLDEYNSVSEQSTTRSSRPVSNAPAQQGRFKN